MASGEELLIAETAERDREGLRRLFDAEGYMCTVSGDQESARDLVQRKFFPVAVIDLDFGSTNGGLEFARFVQERSAPTQIVLLTGRRSFEAAVDALRLGVVDIVSKRPDQIHHLNTAVAKAIHKYRAGDKEGSLFQEVRGVLDESMKIMFAMGKRLYGGASGASGLTMKPAILVIDEDQDFLRAVAAIVADRPWEVSVELSGGSGLDKASSFSFQIVAVREELSDLPGQILVRSAQAQQTQCLALLYSTAGEGYIERYEAGQRTGSDRIFRGPEHLIAKLDELVGELTTRREERRYMQTFRSEHGQFLRRFADLKGRIDSLLE
jgi:DNA-binding NtrC family response regulator